MCRRRNRFLTIDDVAQALLVEFKKSVSRHVLNVDSEAYQNIYLSSPLGGSTRDVRDVVVVGTIGLTPKAPFVMVDRETIQIVSLDPLTVHCG